MDNGKDVIENPFAGFNASLMDDDEILKYWIRPEILFEQQAIGIDLTGFNPVVLMGGRGTGKTMLLKYLSNEVQVKQRRYDKIPTEDFLKDTPYIGVYYRFDGPSLSSFTNRCVGNIVWETIFKHYFEIVIGQKYVSMLLNLKKNGCFNLTSKKEEKIVLDMMNLIYPSKEFKEGEYNLETLIGVIQRLADEVFQFINDAALSEKPTFKPDTVIPPGKLIFDMPNVFVENIPELKNKTIIILLDEYENLLLDQQKIVNTLIKHVKKPVTFRVGMRLQGFKTFDTLNEGEFLVEDADYRQILFEDILYAHKAEYKSLLKKLAEKRLKNVCKFEDLNITDISELLGTLNPVDEALSIVSNGEVQNEKDESVNIEKYKHKKHVAEMIKELKNRSISDDEINAFLPNLIHPQNPLIEMLNLLLIRRDYGIEEIVNLFSAYIDNKTDSSEYKKYKDLYAKNHLGLLFQLVSLHRPKQKMYAGFDMFCMLSSGIIRNFLELCYQSFNKSLFSDREELFEKKRISFKNQTDGAEIRAEKFFNTIERIPERGNEIKSLTSSLGAVFYKWHSDPRLREPEPTYFCVDKTSLSKEGRDVLDTAVRWSVLQKKRPMKEKSRDGPLLDVYALNHILSPYFTISYRTRGRIPQFNKEDVEAMMFKDEAEKKKVVKKLGRWEGTGEGQPTLHDFGGFL